MSDAVLDFETLARKLDASPDHRVLRRFQPHDHFQPFDAIDGMKCAAAVDVETTGTTPGEDKIIELGIVKFLYDDVSRVHQIVHAGSWFEDPGFPIDPKITELTGITDADVAGQTIPDDEIAALVDGCGLIIAHHAGFDRPFCENRFAWAAEKPWACTLNEIDWRALGAPSSSLQTLAWHFGFFFDGHRAEIDCRALVEILSKPHGDTTVLAALLESARTPTWRIWAVNSPFNTKDTLKARGYRWNDGTDGRPKSWWREVPEADGQAEADWLGAEILGREPKIEHVTARQRYSSHT